MLVAVVAGDPRRQPLQSGRPRREAGRDAAAGFPAVHHPDASQLSDLGLLFAGALGIALVSLTDTISTASAFAARSGDEVDGNHEMIGIGAANIAAGFFQGFPVSTSGSRTAVAEQNGAKTQVTGLVGAAAILLMLLPSPDCCATCRSRPWRPS